MSGKMTADVVVIGGGAMGSATAYQLSKAGLGVVLCEMRTLASGATGRCGGMIVHCYGREINIEKTAERLKFTRLNTQMLKAYQQELDIDYHVRHVGCLDIAASEAEFEELKGLIAIQRAQGDDEIVLLDKHETIDCMPTLNKDIVFGSRYRPSDGNLSPYKMVHAFARGAQKHGATIMTHTRVEKILTENDRVTGVLTEKGPIYASWVINCTNAWAKFLGRETECVLPVREVACVTESIGPVPAQSFEMLLNGEFAYGGTQTATGNLTIGGPAHPRDSRLGYYNEVITFDEVKRLATYLTTIFPKLRDLKMIRAWTGTMGFAPDAMPLIGRSTLTEGLLIAAGFAAGISQECTVGKIMTDIITTGEVSLDIDMSLYDPGRFLGQKIQWPEPYDLSILHDYLTAKRHGREKQYQVPYDLVGKR
jgi:sarcosine oxidase subunit beta